MTGGSSRVGTAEEKLKASQLKMGELECEVFGQLLEIRQNSGKVVSGLMAAISRIRAEFFACLAGHWAPVATRLCSFSSSSCKLDGGAAYDAVKAEKAQKAIETDSSSVNRFGVGVGMREGTARGDAAALEATAAGDTSPAVEPEQAPPPTRELNPPVAAAKADATAAAAFACASDFSPPPRRPPSTGEEDAHVEPAAFTPAPASPCAADVPSFAQAAATADTAAAGGQAPPAATTATTAEASAPAAASPMSVLVDSPGPAAEAASFLAEQVAAAGAVATTLLGDAVATEHTNVTEVDVDIPMAGTIAGSTDVVDPVSLISTSAGAVTEGTVVAELTGPDDGTAAGVAGGEGDDPLEASPASSAVATAAAAAAAELDLLGLAATPPRTPLRAAGAPPPVVGEEDKIAEKEQVEGEEKATASPVMENLLGLTPAEAASGSALGSLLDLEA